jgi:hypothetical protein
VGKIGARLHSKKGTATENKSCSSDRLHDPWDMCLFFVTTAAWYIFGKGWSPLLWRINDVLTAAWYISDVFMHSWCLGYMIRGTVMSIITSLVVTSWIKSTGGLHNVPPLMIGPMLVVQKLACNAFELFVGCYYMPLLQECAISFLFLKHSIDGDVLPLWASVRMYRC